MSTQLHVKDYANDKPRMFLQLRELSVGNPTLERIWLRNYERTIYANERR
jgi:hypothetical protein